MNEARLRDLYLARGSSEEEVERAISVVHGLQGFLRESGATPEKADADQIREYIGRLSRDEGIRKHQLIALARYFNMLGAHDAYILIALMLGSDGVMENIGRRLSDRMGESTARAILDGFTFPPLGTSQKEMPAYTREFMERIEARLSPAECAHVLSGNNHGVSRQSMQEDKKRYEESASLDVFLKEMHDRKVAWLQEYCDAKRIWFEQVITQDVVDFVKSNQEIMSAVRVGDRLYVTKIPFDTVRLLKETDPRRRRYYACHCPFVRDSLLRGDPTISPNWCYCSAGYVKFQFEVIFDTELEAETLESPLLGHDRCRFAIKLPAGMKHPKG